MLQRTVYYGGYAYVPIDLIAAFTFGRIVIGGNTSRF